MGDKNCERIYKAYIKKQDKVYNEVLREKEQSYADAMCSGSIVEGLDEKTGKEVLEIIKNAEKRDA
ncbi:MAG: hypothetical protein FWG98_06430 [Candidatus Cloacimonetes bacterium]|nr:hypothetical protein [Candidatus Cloacimonadota bacterium]